MSPGAEGIITLAVMGFINNCVLPENEKSVRRFLNTVCILCMLFVAFFGQR
jgi:hypothetical protein